MLTSLRCAKGDLAGNLASHRGLVELAADQGCDLVLLPEMSLTGYLPAAAAARLLGRDQVLVVSTGAGATDDEDFPGWAAHLEPGGNVAAELPVWRARCKPAHPAASKKPT